MMKLLASASRPFFLLLFLSLSAIPLSGCGSSGNTVVEPGDGTMDEQEMEDYNKQMEEKDESYEDRYK
ncbi:hypothetical protein [Allorhodopirellula heiligendammensis]|uniref:Secreted protein n=1 Tax=Allorhodopirellula heiligendammensis TaxID=2714739 RepID=A0A5C6C6L0_9BACT|nr:hypothetical protein [Allorhodopirellula heiligendammensis]TWU19617.1 hypothetical protein Poly21_17920 [Allorhodopirellula heiligendammensis]|tara:strand:- start:630 stop:833 length:204 start_codon:yes stop_codon:yes gene_type:complete